MESDYGRTTPTAVDAEDAEATGPVWRAWPRAILSGFAASVVMLAGFALAYAVAWGLAMLLPAGVPVLGTLGQWFSGLTDNALTDLARPNLYAAVAVYLAGGIFWALLYAAVFAPRLRGPHWYRGAIYALVPWLFSLLVFLPLVGGGILGLALGAGPLPIIGNLILHLIYGPTMAEVYAHGDLLLDGDHHVPTAVDVSANRGAETGAATGMVLGTVAGGLAGILAAAIGGSMIPGTATVAGEMAANPLAIVLGAALVGGALGALAGSLLGIVPGGGSAGVRAQHR
jgi:hypothetical protein